MDFGVDSELLDELVENLKGAADKMEDEINLIYSSIDSLQEDWDGESYGKFYERCYSYRNSLETLLAVIRAFTNLLDVQVRDNIVNLEEKISYNLSD